MKTEKRDENRKCQRRREKLAVSKVSNLSKISDASNAQWVETMKSTHSYYRKNLSYELGSERTNERNGVRGHSEQCGARE